MQSQSLKCTDARHLIHLAVGDDTLPDEEHRLGEHLHQCADCRGYHADMMNVMHVIENVRDDDSVEIPGGSLWPAMADRLSVRRPNSLAQPRRQFNISVVALCACSLMLALVTLVQNLPLNDMDSEIPAYAMPAMNVNFRPVGTQNRMNVQPAQRRLVEVIDASGQHFLVDPLTNQVYVPGTMNRTIPAADSTLNF
ncbi:MAG: zf-HC2 domain-containing protein [Planctomycetaceae bacterium]|nr:zf-HC2 domain-containing protein [Planctomycetaceae bacterium]